MSNGSGLFSDQSPLKPHLLRGSGGVASEIGDLRRDVGETLEPLVAQTVDEFTNPAAGAANDLKAATAVTVAPATVLEAGLLAGGLAKLAAYPRNIKFTTAGNTPADAPATATITGTYNGVAQSEVVNVPQTASSASSTKPFSTIESIVYSAGQGTDATVAIGVGDSLGVTKTPKARAGAVIPMREIAVGAVVTTGTLTADGLYTPAAAPDGTRDYAVYYEYSL